MDIIRDYRRINSYVTSVAYAILENAEKYGRHSKKSVGPVTEQYQDI